MGCAAGWQRHMRLGAAGSLRWRSQRVSAGSSKVIGDEAWCSDDAVELHSEAVYRWRPSKT